MKSAILWSTDEYYEKIISELCENIDESDAEAVIFLKVKGYREYINYEEIFSIDANDVCGIVFEEALISKCGGLNYKLSEGYIFEFVCRILKVIEKATIVNVDKYDLSENTNEAAFVVESDSLSFLYAYIIKLHMDELKKRNIIEDTFGKVYEMMNNHSCVEMFRNYFDIFISDTDLFNSYANITAPYLILKGEADISYGVLQKFAVDLAESFVRLGQAVIIVGDEEDEEKSNQYNEFIGKLFKGIIGFQTKALEIDYFSSLEGPKYLFWFDYPLHFSNIFTNKSSDYYILCQDADYAKLIRDYHGIENAMQFPPGGVVDIEPDYVNERPYDIVFMGSFFEHRSDGLDEEQKAFYDYMITHPILTFEAGLRAIMNLSEKDSINDEFLNKMIHMKLACRAVIEYYRELVINTIIESGYKIHFYGENWNRFPCDERYRQNMIIHRAVTVDESLEELRKAKIGLNIMSWHKSGMTERIANIMLSGAVCLSDKSEYLDNIDNDAIRLFSLDKLYELPTIIEEILDDEDNRVAMAQKAYKIANDEFSWDARANRLVDLSYNHFENKNEVKVFVATHVAFKVPNDSIYVPIQVGKATKEDLGYLGDNTGDSISSLNYLYGELTALYWIWQNYHYCEYVGLCHYRRYFISDKLIPMNSREYVEMLGDRDAIVPKHMTCDDRKRYIDQFAQAHNVKDLMAVRSAIERIYPDYIEAFDNAMNGNIFYWGNLIFTRKDILDDYAYWLFSIFVEASGDINVSGYDDYHKRVYGFLSEQMFYVYALKNNLTLVECSVGVSSEKAETKELTEELKMLLEKGNIELAREKLSKKIKDRPDLLLSGSDINGELMNIYEKIYHK